MTENLAVHGLAAHDSIVETALDWIDAGRAPPSPP